MRHTVKKWFWVWDFQKEEQWLQQMAAKGLALVSVGFARYEFEDTQGGEYDVCLQLLEQNIKHPESVKYIEFLEQTGAEHVGTYGRWIFVRKKRAEGGLQLFSDYQSRVKQLSRIIGMIVPVSVANILIGISNISLLFTLSGDANAVGLINLLLGLLGCFGWYKLSKMKKALQEQAQIFE